MGHYASEMSSTWSESIDHTDKILKLRDKIKDIPLSAFKASDIILLCRLFDSIESHRLGASEIRQLKKRVDEWHK